MTVKLASILVEAAARRRTAIISSSTRSISVGTDMISSVISLQKSRPWHASDSEGSNAAVDNAVTLKELFGNKTVAVFGVPAPFTGTCSNVHYPGYKALADDILEAGADEIVCYSVSDPYAMGGWAHALKNDPDKIRFLADDGTFAKAYGVDANYDKVSLGDRSKRFSMIVRDGHVATFRVVDDAATDAETLLEELKEVIENEK
jgi:peroxiredoxin